MSIYLLLQLLSFMYEAFIFQLLRFRYKSTIENCQEDIIKILSMSPSPCIQQHYHVYSIIIIIIITISILSIQYH